MASRKLHPMTRLLGKPRPGTSIARMLAIIAALTVIAAACGGSSDSSDAVADDQPQQPSSSTLNSADDDTAAEPEPDVEPEVELAFEGELVGLFAMDPASCATDDISGSYFRMVQPGGTLNEGPFIPNADSPCTDGTYSALFPGTDGGLRTDTVQLAPEPAFDDAGNGLSMVIAEPVVFFGVDFALAIDGETASPSITSDGGVLTGDMSSWSANYANLSFNQGAPKPDGSFPGLTSDVAGTIDLDTGAYVLEWSSQIVGGSFNDFTGVWHLEGTFTPA